MGKKRKKTANSNCFIHKNILILFHVWQLLCEMLKWQYQKVKNKIIWSQKSNNQ
ncbi:MAG: hypothetical protein MRERV_15c024 [Mycoplasmataceae bacterium RV_VA103A]|nr:MAG: hypothetical protein MRERV_15c024 [Mycoplasmataceae bacterium RV_VA103A]